MVFFWIDFVIFPMNVFTLAEPRVTQSRQLGENQVGQCPPTIVESTSKKALACEASTDEISTVTEQPVNLVVQEVISVTNRDQLWAHQ